MFHHKSGGTLWIYLWIAFATAYHRARLRAGGSGFDAGGLRQPRQHKLPLTASLPPSGRSVP